MKAPDFNRNKSAASVGQLYPVLKAKDGRVIDGLHRLDDNPGWRTETLEHIDTEEKILLARAVSNWHRRPVSWREKKAWVDGLAQLYLDQGLRVYGKSDNPRVGAPVNEIMNRIVKELGVCRQTVSTYLDAKFKQTGKGGNQGGPRVPASQSIRTIAKSRPRLSGKLVERHEKEIREKLLHDKSFRKAVMIQMQKEALAMEEEEDPALEALTTQSFDNLVFQYQDGLRSLKKNPTLATALFAKRDRASLLKWGVLERGHKLMIVHLLTHKAQVSLAEIS